MKTTIALFALLIAGLGATAAEDNASPFTAKEVSFDSFYSFSVADLGHVTNARGNGIGAGATYYHTANIGVAASVVADEHLSSVVDQLSSGIRLRLPLNSVALYATADVLYDLRSSNTTYLTGVGAEWRFSERLGCFGEAAYDWDSGAADDIQCRVGIRYNF